jgi:hypothetical protein
VEVNGIGRLRRDKGCCIGRYFLGSPLASIGDIRVSEGIGSIRRLTVDAANLHEVACGATGQHNSVVEFVPR